MNAAYRVFPVLALALVVSACDSGNQGPADGSLDAGPDADSAADSDSDADTDTDTDTDIDTDTDTDGDGSFCEHKIPPLTAECDEFVCDDSFVRFVKADAPDGGTGLSWESPFGSVQKGIDSAFDHAFCCSERAEVWVAAGTYMIWQGSPCDTVFLRKGVSIYGGFKGMETSRDERDWRANETILDGADSEDDYNGVFHVVFGSDDATIDGFTITGGEADEDFLCNPPEVEQPEHPFHEYGGGIINEDGSTRIVHCTFRDNHARWGGGAVYISSGSPSIIDCVFEDNSSYHKFATSSIQCIDGEGGAIHNSLGSPLIQNSVFFGNYGLRGGAVYNYEGSCQIVSCTIAGNLAEGGGAVFSVTSPGLIITDSILWNNYSEEIMSFDSVIDVFHSIVRDGFDGAGNLDSDPLFRGGSLYDESYKGTWTDVSFDTHDTILVDENAAWPYLKLARSYIRLDVTESGNFYLFSPYSANTLHIPGNLSGDVKAGDSYQIYIISNVPPDLHLRPGSPAIDAADGVMAPALDIDGQCRLDDPASVNVYSCSDAGPDAACVEYADMGAYEYVPAAVDAGQDAAATDAGADAAADAS